jgi:NADH-quinone oxidoreductase subunit C
MQDLQEKLNHLATQLREQLDDHILSCVLLNEELTIEVKPESLRKISKILLTDPQFAFEQLMDVCGVDYLHYGLSDWETEQSTEDGFSRGVAAQPQADAVSFSARFAVVYHLLSLKHNMRLRMRVMLAGDPPRVDTVTDIWASANWFEREAFDLFGILFNGHPDLRRLLTDYGFIGHPFRKDFPLIGTVEVRYDPEQQRVIYQPVTIEPRILVPKVIRHDQRYAEIKRD